MLMLIDVAIELVERNSLCGTKDSYSSFASWVSPHLQSRFPGENWWQIKFHADLTTRIILAHR
jgi:hypothetical protein